MNKTYKELGIVVSVVTVLVMGILNNVVSVLPDNVVPDSLVDILVTFDIVVFMGFIMFCGAVIYQWIENQRTNRRP